MTSYCWMLICNFYKLIISSLKPFFISNCTFLKLKKGFNNQVPADPCSIQ